MPWGANAGSAAGRHPGRGLLNGSTQSVGGGEPPLHSLVAKHPICCVGFRRAGGRLESHMMSQTMTQAGCLILTRHPSCTMSHPRHPARRVRVANTRPQATPPFASCRHSPRLRGSGPGRRPVGEPRGRAGERVVSRAAVGGSPGGETPPGEFRESSAALH